jgi:hypothetical protein
LDPLLAQDVLVWILDSDSENYDFNLISSPPQAGMAHGTPLYRDISEIFLINK